MNSTIRATFICGPKSHCSDLRLSYRNSCDFYFTLDLSGVTRGRLRWSQLRAGEVLDLVSISVQAKDEGSYRNPSVFLKAHRNECLNRATEERGCSVRVKTLKAKFKDAKDSDQRHSHGRITCLFYSELDGVWGDKVNLASVRQCEQPKQNKAVILNRGLRLAV